MKCKGSGAESCGQRSNQKSTKSKSVFVSSDLRKIHISIQNNFFGARFAAQMSKKEAGRNVINHLVT